MNRKEVLIAEDEPALGQIIQERLQKSGFTVTLVQDGQLALKAYSENSPDILVLDVIMPKMDGFKVAQEIRRTNSKIPILFLTAKSKTQNVLEGFAVGGNDYLKKPFSMEELVMRIKNLVGHQDLDEDIQKLNIGNYIFDYHRRTLIYYNSEKTILTNKEADLLYHLYLNRNRVLYRSPVLIKLWGDDDFFSGRSMDVFISRLRKKLSKDPNLKILNVRSYGYKLIL